MASVAIRDVRKAFGSAHVIVGVDISIRDGEFVVLVGRGRRPGALMGARQPQVGLAFLRAKAR